MPYLVADKLGPESTGGARAPAPYTSNRMEDGKLAHYLDADRLRSSPEGLARILADGLVLEVGTEVLQAEIGRIRAWPARRQAPFALLDEAESALSGPIYSKEFEATYVGDTVVDAELIYPNDKGFADYRLGSTLDPGLPGQDDTANLILDHASEPPLVFRLRGLMAQPVEVSHSVRRDFRSGSPRCAGRWLSPAFSSPRFGPASVPCRFFAPWRDVALLPNCLVLDLVWRL